jgi:hypothetical protein
VPILEKIEHTCLSLSTKSNFLAEFCRHAAHFLKSLGQSVLDFPLLGRIAGRQESIPLGELLAVGFSTCSIVGKSGRSIYAFPEGNLYRSWAMCPEERMYLTQRQRESAPSAPSTEACSLRHSARASPPPSRPPCKRSQRWCGTAITITVAFMLTKISFCELVSRKNAPSY